ncbi:unnamed protein product, partial [Porites evermanni]
GKKRKRDREFKGPIADRSCTDIPCCILFLAYIVGMIIVGIIAFQEGDPDRLLLPTDSNGNTCGKGNHHVYNVPHPFCPIRNSLLMCVPTLSYNGNKYAMVQHGKCAPYYLKSQSVLYRCIPTLVDNLIDSNGSVIQNVAGTNMTKTIIQGGINGLKILMNLQNFGLNVSFASV